MRGSRSKKEKRKRKRKPSDEIERSKIVLYSFLCSPFSFFLSLLIPRPGTCGSFRRWRGAGGSRSCRCFCFIGTTEKVRASGNDRGRNEGNGDGRHAGKSSSIFSLFEALYCFDFQLRRERAEAANSWRNRRKMKRKQEGQSRVAKERKKPSGCNRGRRWGRSSPLFLLPCFLLRPYRGMSTPAASQAAMTLAPFGMVTDFPLTVHSTPSAGAAGAGAGVDASERARKKSMPTLSLLLLLLAPQLPLLLPLVLAAAPPSARAAARRAAARAPRSIFLASVREREGGTRLLFLFLRSLVSDDGKNGLDQKNI